MTILTYLQMFYTISIFVLLLLARNCAYNCSIEPQIIWYTDKMLMNSIPCAVQAKLEQITRLYGYSFSLTARYKHVWEIEEPRGKLNERGNTRHFVHVARVVQRRHMTSIVRNVIVIRLWRLRMTLRAQWLRTKWIRDSRPWTRVRLG